MPPTPRLPILITLLALATITLAQKAPEPKTPQTVPALLLSDIHFDPFHDPALVPHLAPTPPDKWDTVLAGTPSPTQAKDFDALQLTCKLRGVDTGYPLWHASLQAIRAQAAGSAFVTVSGDLLAHSFPCKFAQAFPHAKPGDYLAFVLQTIQYVTHSLQTTLPNTPIYLAMGNNDSGCGDYSDSSHSPFLTETAKIVAQALPPNADRAAVQASFATEGFYAAPLPPAIPNTRVLVLDSIFLSAHHTDCAGQTDAAAAEDQVTWLQTQLGEARSQKEKVWLIAHIPPGVDLYGTLKKMADICRHAAPQMFLANERMAQILAENADIVRLAIFAHSHTDEFRLLTSETPEPSPRPDTKPALRPGVPVKIVTSISPVNGNKPAFTLARIDPATANLVDYTVIAASTLTGTDGPWTPEYTFSNTYHQPAYTAPALKAITDAFIADPTANTPESAAYLRDIFVGDRSPLLKPFWPEYACALTHDSAQSFADCVCSQ
jgi:sphingomyelin phosphodiesterase acid-like 3